MNLTESEIFAFNTGLKQAQWQITKAMMSLESIDLIGVDLELHGSQIKQILKFIHDEIAKEMK